MRLTIVVVLLVALVLTGCGSAPAATVAPTTVPTVAATTAPTAAPTAVPTAAPTAVPTAMPTAAPTVAATEAATVAATEAATAAATAAATTEAAAGATMEATVAAAVTAAPEATAMATGISAGEPSVTVVDQAIVGGTVIVAKVVSQGPGWMVIHADANGGPGPVIGFAPLFDGVNVDVVVQVDASKATATLYAMLHTDVGTVGKYEFPGADGPVSVNGQVVTPPFKITGGLPAAGATSAATAPAAAATTAATTVATAAATTAATTAPTAAATAAATTVALVGDASQAAAIADQLGCVNCHSVDGSAGVGPTWKGLYGSTVKLADGTSVTADDAYIHESIVEPDAKVVEGFKAGTMRSFAGKISEQQIADLIAFLKTLK